MVSDSIRKWVPAITAKYGKSALNDSVIGWFEAAKDRMMFEDHGDWYLVYGIFPDEWGDLSLHVLSAGTSRPPAFWKMRARIGEIARQSKCRWILEASELDERYNRFLERRGYSACYFRKEVK